MNPKQLERLGELVDTCDNFLAWMDNPAAPISMKLDAIAIGLGKVRANIKELYTELGGSDEWPE